ncbi:MAG: glycerophosphodiester phosphodiesterase family protein [Armatimonadota bacterium]|nr:glycerophosphodiester phosphodiesterase family protein [Armatimonadota bacterium]
MTRSFRDAITTRRFLVVAHRGASAYAPENTLPAFELACDQGADVIELDVHLTRDDEVVVMHDHRVDRTTDGRGEVRALTLREIASLDAGAWFGAAWRGTGVPTLRDVLDRFAGRVLIDIEIKGGVTSGWRTGGVREDAAASVRLARRTLEVVREAGALARVVIASFGPRALASVIETCPDVPTQWSVFSRDIAQDCAFAAQARFDVISPQAYAATRANVETAHRHGLAVYIYAGDGDDATARVMDSGADAVKTDRPDRLRALVAARGRA